MTLIVAADATRKPQARLTLPQAAKNMCRRRADCGPLQSLHPDPAEARRLLPQDRHRNTS